MARPPGRFGQVEAGAKHLRGAIPGSKTLKVVVFFFFFFFFF